MPPPIRATTTITQAAASPRKLPRCWSVRSATVAEGRRVIAVPGATSSVQLRSTHSGAK